MLILDLFVVKLKFIDWMVNFIVARWKVTFIISVKSELSTLAQLSWACIEKRHFGP